MNEIQSKDLKNEELHYEYKKAKGGFPKSFFETYSAFANTDGGYIYLGIEETNNKKYNPSKLTLEDINSLKTNLFTLLNNQEKVNVNLIADEDVEEIKVDNEFVLKIHVKKCPVDLKPIYINKNLYQGTYRRNADGDYRCSIEEINAMIRDASRQSPDLAIVEDCSTSSLDEESIKIYKNMFSSIHPDHPFLKEDTNRFLEYIGAARLDNNDEYHPTKAGLLMFGYSYRIVYQYPSFFLDYQKKSETRWDDRVQSDSGDWSGNVFMFFLKVTNKLFENIPTPFKMEGIYRVDNDELHKAVREALCNTLCNADYNLTTSVAIKQYEDHIEFINPGCLMMDIDQMMNGGLSSPRNRTMLKMFNLINIGERSGSGIPLIVESSKTYNLPLPIIKEYYHPDYTSLILYTKKPLKTNGLTKLEEDIIVYLKDNDKLSAKEISNYLNKNITTIKLTLYSLVDKGIVSSSGTIKDKKYFIK